jgi:hypothetical protein
MKKTFSGIFTASVITLAGMQLSSISTEQAANSGMKLQEIKAYPSRSVAHISSSFKRDTFFQPITF